MRQAEAIRPAVDGQTPANGLVPSRIRRLAEQLTRQRADSPIRHQMPAPLRCIAGRPFVIGRQRSVKLTAAPSCVSTQPRWSNVPDTSVSSRSTGRPAAGAAELKRKKAIGWRLARFVRFRAPGPVRSGADLDSASRLNSLGNHSQVAFEPRESSPVPPQLGASCANATDYRPSIQCSRASQPVRSTRSIQGAGTGEKANVGLFSH